MILIIDCYDSFTYNLVHLIRGVHPACSLIIRRCDEVTLAEIEAISPRGIILSPGPGLPRDAGLAPQIVREFGESVPLLGVCLGQQCIAQALGGRVIPARSLVHGRTSEIHHDGDGIFAGLPSPLVAARYHSLAIDDAHLPPCLKVCARTSDGEIMAIRHRRWPLVGVQFHPESFMTAAGAQIMANFLGPIIDCSSEQPAFNC